ncbi:MAG: uroporphyrinogen-III C-methyltransferase [Congregibacter sp.]
MLETPPDVGEADGSVEDGAEKTAEDTDSLAVEGADSTPQGSSSTLKDAALTAAAASAVVAASAPSTATASSAPLSETPVVAPPTEPAARGNAAPIAWLALVLVLVVAGAGFYLMMDMQRRESLLLQRVQGLEAISGQDTTTFDQMRDNLQRTIDLEIEGIRAKQQRAEQDQQRAIVEQERAVNRLESVASDAAEKTRRDLAGQISTLQQSLEEQRTAMRNQQQRVSDLSVDDRESWLLAEAQYLLRLANQRLIMTGDTASAEALLRSTDDILRELGDADLFGLRSAVAEDLAAVRAVPKLDIQGLYLRLDALIGQTDSLVMFEMPERVSEAPQLAAQDWKTRLAEGYEVALAKLSDYVVVSRRDVPVEALMDPQYEGLVRQNMRMLMEQAQVAMLSGNELLFRQSLERASGWVSQFFKSDEQAAVAMAEELQSIREERVAVDLPDLNRSLQALDATMQARLARDGS